MYAICTAQFVVHLKRLIMGKLDIYFDDYSRPENDKLVMSKADFRDAAKALLGEFIVWNSNVDYDITTHINNFIENK